MNKLQQKDLYLCVLMSICLLSLSAYNFCLVNKNLKLKEQIDEYEIKVQEQSMLLEEKEALIQEQQLIIEDCSNDASEYIVNMIEYIEPLKHSNKQEYIIQYKNIMEKYSNVIDRPLFVTDFYTQEEINIMCRCIETETYQANFNAKVNVASVILNRIENEAFPSTPIAVVTSPNQFAYFRTAISEDTLLALEYAFMIEDTTNGAIAFRSDSNQQQWGRWSYIFTDSVGHSFYK